MTVSGAYIFIEASSPRKEGDEAILYGGPFQGRKDVCLIFYYHMFGAHIGSLSVYKRSMNRTDVERLWTKNASIDRYWHKATINIESKHDYEVMFVLFSYPILSYPILSHPIPFHSIPSFCFYFLFFTSFYCPLIIYGMFRSLLKENVVTMRWGILPLMIFRLSTKTAVIVLMVS